MRKFLLTTVLTASAGIAWAVPAHPGLKTIRQPDGTEVTLALHGDEYLNYTTTGDGYTVVKNEAGFYEYARLEGDRLVSTGCVAHDAQFRLPAERSLVNSLQKGVHAPMSEAMKAFRNSEKTERHNARKAAGEGRYNYDNFKGLIILVEYNDCKFSRDDYVDVFSDMIKKPGFSGYMSADRIPEWVECTGSVYDYYYDNSMGVFEAHFDIVGPVQINRSMYFPVEAVNSTQLMADAVTAADKIVNFADYDMNEDGIIDMVYFVFAGPGSHYTGNDHRLLWPHSANYGNFGVKYADGVKLGRYACSTELSGTVDDNRLEGIGTICHEFSHVLGLEDLYDTDGAGSGGTSEMTPELWSVMDAGCYIDDSKTPAGYSLFERFLIGFATPELIYEEGDYTLEALDTSNTGYQINSPMEREFFILENRQRIKWNKVNPGHGLLVYKVDLTNYNAWEGNYINCDPNHNMYMLLRATGEKYDYTGTPFPGTGERTRLNNTTSPSMQTWTGRDCKLVLDNICESEDGLISFSVIDPTKESEVKKIDSEDVNREYYDLSGRLLGEKPEKSGIYIVKTGSVYTKEIIRQ